MSTIVLEQIEPEIPEEPEQIVPEELDLPDESLEQEAVPSVSEPTQAPTETPAPVLKKRGRPPKAKAEAPPPPIPKVKAAPKPKTVRKPKPPVEESSDSSDVDTTLRNVYNHVAKQDMETAILQFLVNRKQQESIRRRELWGRLAQM